MARVFPGRLRAVTHSCAGWVKASLTWSCLQSLTAVRSGLPDSGSSPGKDSQKLGWALEGLSFPLHLLHGPEHPLGMHPLKFNPTRLARDSLAIT